MSVLPELESVPAGLPPCLHARSFSPRFCPVTLWSVAAASALDLPCSSFTTPIRPSFVDLKPSLQHQLISHPVDCEEVPRLASVVAEFLAQLDDDLIERARGAVVIVTPDFIQQAISRHDFTRMGVEELQDLHFFRRQLLDRLAAFELKGLRINRRGTDLKRRVTGGVAGGRLVAAA